MTELDRDSYQDWMSRVLEGQEGRPLSPGDVVRTSDKKSVLPMEFLRFTREKYIGEVGQKGNDFIYHFFPRIYPMDPFPPNFEEHLAGAFLEVFKLDNRIEAAYAQELNSWAVRTLGFASNPLSDTLTTRVFDVLDKRL